MDIDIMGVRSMFVSRREPSKRPTRLKGNIGALIIRLGTIRIPQNSIGNLSPPSCHVSPCVRDEGSLACFLES